MSCDDGRNLQLLIDLGFEVYASEIATDILKHLINKFPEVKFSVGYNNKQPFKNHYFDSILSCAACVIILNQGYLFKTISKKFKNFKIQ